MVLLAGIYYPEGYRDIINVLSGNFYWSRTRLNAMPYTFSKPLLYKENVS
jgi:hypothetical protein